MLLGRAGLRRRAARPEIFAGFEVPRWRICLQILLDHGQQALSLKSQHSGTHTPLSTHAHTLTHVVLLSPLSKITLTSTNEGCVQTRAALSMLLRTVPAMAVQQLQFSNVKTKVQRVCREARRRDLFLPLGRVGLRRRAVRPEDFADFEVRRCQNSLQVSLDHGHNRQCWHGTGSSCVCLMPTCWIVFVRALWRPCQNDALENDLLEARLRSS